MPRTPGTILGPYEIQAPWSTLQSMIPARLDEIVRTCLAKDPGSRWQSAGDVGRQDHRRWII